MLAKVEMFVRQFSQFLKYLTPWSRVLLGILTVDQLVKKFPACFGTED
jgi:hypothetical protein